MLADSASIAILKPEGKIGTAVCLTPYIMARSPFRQPLQSPALYWRFGGESKLEVCLKVGKMSNRKYRNAPL